MEAITSTEIRSPRPAAAPPRDTPRASGNKLPAGGKDQPPAPPVVDLKGAVEQIQSYLSSSRRSLHFRLDEASGRSVITVTNPETGELIRQIPGEEVLKLAAAINGGSAHLLDTLA